MVRTPPRSDPERAAQLAAERAEAEAERAEAARVEAERIAAEQAEQQAVAAARACIDREIGEISEGCQASAASASETCKGTNSEAIAASDSISGSARELISTKKSGSQRECFDAGVFSYGAGENISGVRDTCGTNVERCTQSCGLETEESENNIKTICGEEIGDREPVLAYLRERVSTIGSEVEASKATCAQASTELDQLNTLVNNTGDSTHKAAMCACMLSSGGQGVNGQTGACNSIPSMQDCAENPENQGCTAYAAMAACAPGSSNYDENACNCQRNPQGPGCSANILSAAITSVGAISSAGISSFAANSAPITNSVVGAGVSVGSGSGPRAASDLSLNSKGGSDSSSEPFVLKDQAKANAPAGGASGGVVSTGSNGATQQPGEEAAVEEEGTKGIAGMFGLAKTFISKSLFKSGAVSGDAKTAKKGFVDFARFKPRRIRGIASEEEDGSSLGKSNMDIWIMMNKCSGGESCRSNINNYITTP